MLLFVVCDLRSCGRWVVGCGLADVALILLTLGWLSACMCLRGADVGLVEGVGVELVEKKAELLTLGALALFRFCNSDLGV
jgi:hypothetical protein